VNDDRPLRAFADIWTKFKGGRGTQSKPCRPASLLAITAWLDNRCAPD
jgi:hypothetical protein